MVLVLPTDPVTATMRAFVRARAARPSALKRGQHVVHDVEGAVPRSASACASSTTAAAAPFAKAGRRSRGRRCVSPLMAKNRSPGCKRAACRSRCRRRRARQRAATRGVERRDERRGRTRAAASAHRHGPGRARPATASWSEKGSMAAPTIWPVSWPLPATTRTSPARSMRDRGGDRLGRGRRSRSRPGAAAEDRGADGGGILGARVVVRDDDDVGQAGGDLAHHRPLAGIAVAAAAEHDDERRASHRGAACRSTFSSASGLWA